MKKQESFKHRWLKYTPASEDSTKWKCKWITCIHGIGLAGCGMCSARGNWDKKDCKYYEKQPYSEMKKPVVTGKLHN